MAPAFDSVFGSGDVFPAQLFVLACVIAGAAAALYACKRAGMNLRTYAVPISLFFVSGTLDALITARGTFGNPALEGNAALKLFIESGGWLFQGIASVLWIFLWAGIAILIHKLGQREEGRWKTVAAALILSEFYSLAAGHYFGFSSWTSFMPGKEVYLLMDGVFAALPTPFSSLLYTGMSCGALLAIWHVSALRILKKDL